MCWPGFAVITAGMAGCMRLKQFLSSAQWVPMRSTRMVSHAFTLPVSAKAGAALTICAAAKPAAAMILIAIPVLPLCVLPNSKPAGMFHWRDQDVTSGFHGLTSGTTLLGSNSPSNERSLRAAPAWIVEVTEAKLPAEESLRSWNTAWPPC